MAVTGAHLYELADGLREAVEGLVDDETGEILDASALDAAAGAFDAKCEACAVVVKEAKEMARAIGGEISALSARKRACENRARRLREYVAGCMREAGRARVETPRARVSLRASRSVEVADGAALGDEFTVEKTEVRPDRKAIAEALEAGRDVPGARLVEKWSVSVR